MIKNNTLLLALAMIPGTTVAQVPPPPLAVGQDSLATELFASFYHKNADLYASLLNDNVKVVEDGNLIASNKKDWLRIFLPKLLAKGVYFKIPQGFRSGERLLVIEYFNSTNSWGSITRDCCWSYDAVAYDVSNGKITAIRRLHGGNVKLDEHGAAIK